MNFALYIIIFLSKVLEISLGTLRLIVVSNGKKGLGAALIFVISILWILITGVVVIDIAEDPLKILFFALGSYVGSYVGSYIEEKMALGNNMLISIIDQKFSDAISGTLRQQGFAVTILSGEGKDKERSVLMIMVPRKLRKEVVNIIKTVDVNSMIVSEDALPINGGYMARKRK